MTKILVAEDDKHTNTLMKAVLKHAGYEVLQAYDGQEALDLLDKNPVDLVLLDVMMPKMDGYAFCRHVRSVNNSIPVLMVTAKGLPADKIEGFRSGTDDYMTKPVNEEEMLLRIQALLRRSRISTENRLVIKDMILDGDTFTVSRPGETISLPQKEFQLLFKLLSSPKQIFTRLQLMDEIWGPECETGEATVTVHVNRLRKKFEGWDKFEIINVRGVGYKGVICP